MAIFKEAIAKTLINEGGYVDNPNDLGGTTNYGISLRFLQSVDKKATKETIKKLTKEQAEELYFQHFWLSNKYDEINSQEIADKVFDTAVNMGAKVANRFLQKALNIFTCNGEPLSEDGIIGKKTIEAVNSFGGNSVLQIYSLLQKEHYTKIVANRKDQVVFLKGWLNRANA